MTRPRRPRHAPSLGRFSRPSSRLLLLGVFCLLIMPQSYNGGASVSHPHAIFQFWIPGGHLTAADHHGSVSGMTSAHESDDHAHHEASYSSPDNHALMNRSVRPDIPTISQVTPAAERSDMIGGILEPWFALILALLAGLFAARTVRSGLTPLPELPPPRLSMAT